MPNTLAHLAIQSVATRSLLRDADPKWIFIGCIITDVPWIGQRAALMALPGLDPLDLRVYVTAQASLACSILLCGALALCSRTPRFVFAILTSNSLLHLLLDACQTKWGNGVHILAPFSWHTWNLGWFWPESAPTYALTGFGLVYAIWALQREWVRPSAPFGWPSIRRLAVAAALLCAYLLIPLVLAEQVEAADAHYVRTVRERERRIGRPLEIDRSWFRSDEWGGRVSLLGGEVVDAVGALPDRSTRVSVRGRFLDPQTLAVHEIHEHHGWRRDLASYVGLALVLCIWALAVRALVRTWLQRLRDRRR